MNTTYRIIQQNDVPLPTDELVTVDVDVNASPTVVQVGETLKKVVKGQTGFIRRKDDGKGNNVLLDIGTKLIGKSDGDKVYIAGKGWVFYTQKDSPYKHMTHATELIFQRRRKAAKKKKSKSKLMKELTPEQAADTPWVLVSISNLMFATEKEAREYADDNSVKGDLGLDKSGKFFLAKVEGLLTQNAPTSKYVVTDLMSTVVKPLGLQNIVDENPVTESAVSPKQVKVVRGSLGEFNEKRTESIANAKIALNGTLVQLEIPYKTVPTNKPS